MAIYLASGGMDLLSKLYKNEGFESYNVYNGKVLFNRSMAGNRKRHGNCDFYSRGIDWMTGDT
jgi:hypothetical protein